jgi:murein DD-endopeptidase MepM/ murein hydrolase activator NlpD
LPQIDFVQTIDALSARIDNRWAQLDTLEGVLDKTDSSKHAFVSGLPIRKGWQSSPYGYRTDPFTGQIAWHSGIDFAGKEGSDVLAAGAGVVTWAEDRDGYGLLVEINHGDGYLTRYAHNKETKVKVGDVVQKGQIIALMGNSGRSTGAHVHYEVYKNGRAVDPASYLHRTYR